MSVITTDSKDKYSVLKTHIDNYGSVDWKSTVSYVTYKRTYSRRLNDYDPESKTEVFVQTLYRIIVACNEQLGMNLTPEEQCEYFDMFASFKALPAGRFLWQLGTKTVDKLGLLSLQNCAFTIVDDYESFCWSFDALMLGSGVGYNIQAKYVNKLPVPCVVKVTRTDRKDAGFIVPDSREGWVELLRCVLRKHFSDDHKNSKRTIKFDYSCHCLRSKGAPIRGFGGTASGPEFLCDGITDINKIINTSAEKGLRLRPIDCLDIMNIVARMVISGNVRRSAQIAIGDCNDLEFLKAKRWDLGNIPNWRCFSNNSVVCDDISKLPEEFWEGYKGNGECYGLINLELSKKIGRTGETKYPDPDVAGYNPSLRANTRILTDDGIFPIQNLENKFFKIKNINGGWSLARCWKSGKDKPLYELTLFNGKKYWSTAEHKWIIQQVNQFAVQDVAVQDADVQDVACEQTSLIELTHVLTTDIKQHDKLIYRRSQILFEQKKSNGTYTDGFCLGLLYCSPTQFLVNDQYVWCIQKSMPMFVSILLSWVRSIDDTVINLTEQKSGKGEDYIVVTTKSSQINTRLREIGVTDEISIQNESYGIPDSVWVECENFRKGFVDAIFSTVGGIDVNKGVCHIANKSETFVNDLWDLIGFYGIAGTVKTELKTTNGEDVMPILIFDATAFENTFTVTHAAKSDALRKMRRPQNTVSDIGVSSCVLTDMKEDVWDISVYDDAHAFALSQCYTGNCGEQSLANKETCCLAELFLPNVESQEELSKCAKMVYRMAKHSMSLPCHQHITEDIVHKHMRMGVGITGVLQVPKRMDWLDKTYKELREYDVIYSAKHGFPTSIKLTTVKPSGCVHPNTIVRTNLGDVSMSTLFEKYGTNPKKGWYKPDSDLKVFDMNNIAQTVTKLYSNGVTQCVKFNVDEEEIICTPDHKFLVDRWIKASELRVGDTIRNYDTIPIY